MRPDARVLVLGCGALARELLDVTRRLGGIEVACLPARLHNTPQLIPDAVRERLRTAVGCYDRVFVAYGDCGTGGALDKVLAEFGVERLTGPHCYEFLAGAGTFAELEKEEVATLYLTDYLTRNFERLIWSGLGLDRHPELRDLYFSNYRRVVYLSQYPSPDLIDRAREAADRLGLDFEHRHTGLGDLEPQLVSLAHQVPVAAGT